VKHSLSEAAGGFCDHRCVPLFVPARTRNSGDFEASEPPSNRPVLLPSPVSQSLEKRWRTAAGYQLVDEFPFRTVDPVDVLHGLLDYLGVGLPPDPWVIGPRKFARFLRYLSPRTGGGARSVGSSHNRKGVRLRRTGGRRACTRGLRPTRCSLELTRLRWWTRPIGS